MQKIRYIASICVAFTYLLIAIGIPFYTIYCECSGEAEFSLYMQPESCTGENCHDCCKATDASFPQQNSEIQHPHCDLSTYHYLSLKNEHTSSNPFNRTVVAANPNLEALFQSHSSIVQSVLQETGIKYWDQENHPLLRSSDYLNLICQRKIPLTC